MKIVTNLLKDSRDEWLVNTTSIINTVNPIIDRIMEDDSVEGVIMTNKEEGKIKAMLWKAIRSKRAPILTNVSATRATNYGLELQRLGHMGQNYIKELDPFEEIVVMRLKTKTIEIMLAPHPEFNIIVIQHGRRKSKENKEIKIKQT